MGGDPAPPGCNKTFVDDGGIPCWDNTDCPDPGTCQNKLCNFVPNCDCGPGDPDCVELWDAFYECKKTEPDCARTAPVFKSSCKSSGEIISFTSPISGQYTHTNSCPHCSQTTCPPSRPCRRGGQCYRPRCNRRGRCWCRNDGTGIKAPEPTTVIDKAGQDELCVAGQHCVSVDGCDSFRAQKLRVTSLPAGSEERRIEAEKL